MISSIIEAEDRHPAWRLASSFGRRLLFVDVASKTARRSLQRQIEGAYEGEDDRHCVTLQLTLAASLSRALASRRHVGFEKGS
jgi:hypothetical protein